MKGLIFHGKNDIRFESLEYPQIEDDRDVLVRAKACGICGSDLHLYHDDFAEIGEGFELGRGFCVGHEAVGAIVEKGKDVTNLKVGDTVMLAACQGGRSPGVGGRRDRNPARGDAWPDDGAVAVAGGAQRQHLDPGREQFDELQGAPPSLREQCHDPRQFRLRSAQALAGAGADAAIGPVAARTVHHRADAAVRRPRGL